MRSVLFSILFLGVAGSTLSAGASGACYSESERFFAEHPNASEVFVCKDSETQLCAKPSDPSKCERINVLGAVQKISSPAALFGQSKARHEFSQNKSSRKKILAVFLAAMGFDHKISMQPTLEIQTGNYPTVSASTQALNSKCMATIVQAAYKLHKFFPDHSFVVDSHIQNCNNLRDGIKRLLAQSERVKKNLNRIANPMAAVFLTDKTKYVHNELGRIGLHINVDAAGEIERHLIDFEIGSLLPQRAQRVSGLQISADSGLSGPNP